MNTADVILKVEDLKTYFYAGGGLFSQKKVIKAVDGVSLEIFRGETLGLVGESGCGKSTLGRTIVKLYEPAGGKIYFDGQDVTALQGGKLKQFRKDVQMIFQDPYASLDPRMTIGEILKEPMTIHELYQNDAQREQRAVELLRIVGLKPDHIRRYPHEFSGGQRQRISIARTLALDPKFIICDEPISALDVSIQAQIINLLKQIQEESGLSYLFVAHDLSMVKHISNRIAVMYLGHIMEIGDSHELYLHPMHPYSIALLSAVPIPDPIEGKQKRPEPIAGELPSPLNPPTGCPFSTRCPYADDRCKREMPALKEKNGRMIACFRVE
ncbi:MAG: dipeptide ABC transporter ATP-binding protein [Clostridia bacterium]|nr:dipeptide ABC transporter ATP-binding protein [Clostridia bacterium]